MRVLLFSVLFLFAFNAFSNVTYFGKNCKRVTRSNMYSRTSGRVHVNGMLVHEKKVIIERPIRDCWVHLDNPLRHRKTMYHFEDNYKAGSGKFNGNYIQFYDEAGVEFDPVVKGGTLHGIIAIGLENQGGFPAYLEVPGWREIELEPEMSCLYYFVVNDFKVPNPNFKKLTFKVKSDSFVGHLYQKLYYNNNVDGTFLKKQYESIDFESYQGRYIDASMFHEFYPNYPNLN